MPAQRLPMRQVREVLRLRHACGQSERQIAAAIGISRTTVAEYLRRATVHQRNNWLVDSHHPLRETIILQTGLEADARASFLRARQRIALDALVHEWQPVEVGTDD